MTFNADFDGDQMAAHVPLSATAQAEARVLMLSTNNLFSPGGRTPDCGPGSGYRPGCYYLTVTQDAPLKEDDRSRPAEGNLAYEVGELGSAPADPKVRARDGARGYGRGNGEVTERQELQEIETTVGRLIFNSILPEDMRRAEFNRDLDKGAIARVVARCYEMHGSEATVKLLDDLKALGFRFATRAGVLSHQGYEHPGRPRGDYPAHGAAGRTPSTSSTQDGFLPRTSVRRTC